MSDAAQPIPRVVSKRGSQTGIGCASVLVPLDARELSQRVVLQLDSFVRDRVGRPAGLIVLDDADHPV